MWAVSGTPVVQVLHRFFIAISWAVVSDDGSAGTAPRHLVWSVGGLPKRRRVVRADAALLPGPAPILDSCWVGVLPTFITADDVCHWPYYVGILVKLVAFLGTLHWPASGADLGLAVSPMSSSSFCMSSGLGRGLFWKRLFPAIDGLVAQSQCRLFLLVQALIFGVPAGSLLGC